MKFLLLLLLPTFALSDWEHPVNSVYFDMQTNRVFAAGMDGAIYTLSETGKEKWVSGLGSPRGMRSYLGMLWVATESGAVALDLQSGRRKKEFAIREAVDVALDRSGAVYTVSRSGAVWRNEEIYLTLKGEIPSAVLVLVDKLYLLSNRALREISLTDKRERVVFRWSRKASGGLELASTGEFLLGDTDKGEILYVTKAGKKRGAKTVPGLSGDFGYKYFKDTSQDRLLLPIREKNQVKAVSPVP